MSPRPKRLRPMNPSPLLLTTALGVLAVSAAPTRDGITADAFAAARQGNAGAFAAIETPTAPVETRRPAQASLLQQSVILNDGRHWTLVPRGAVIHLPEAHRRRVDAKPVGTLLPWNEFLRRNIAWITTEELTLRQAEGVHPVNPRRVQFWSKQDKIVVGVHRGGPISYQASR